MTDRRHDQDAGSSEPGRDPGPSIVAIFLAAAILVAGGALLWIAFGS